MKNYDEKNPLPLNATAEQKSAHSNAKAEAWKNEIDNKQKSIANVLGNGNLKLRNGQEKISYLLINWQKISVLL